MILLKRSLWSVMQNHSIHGLILHNEVDPETMERERCDQFETIVAFQSKVGEATATVETLANAIREMATMANRVSPPHEIGDYTWISHSHALGPRLLDCGKQCPW